MPEVEFSSKDWFALRDAEDSVTAKGELATWENLHGPFMIKSKRNLTPDEFVDLLQHLIQTKQMNMHVAEVRSRDQKTILRRELVFHLVMPT